MTDPISALPAKKNQIPPRMTLLVVLVLTGLIAAVFHPVIGFKFVDWDTFAQVVDNPYVWGLNWPNVKHILTSRCITSYYPVRTLTFALDYEIGGMTPWIFKLNNVLIHVACVLLTYWLALRLFDHPQTTQATRGRAWDVWAAAVAAGLYAIHPVVVEPVVWIAGREELLMTLFALSCLHCHLTARQIGMEPGHKARALLFYLAAALSAAAACLSNAVAAILPVLIVAADIILLQRPKFWRIVGGTSLLWVISIIVIVAKRLGESDIPIPPPLFSWGRVLLVLNVYWLNMVTLFWPTKLSLFYDWVYPNSFSEPQVFLGAFAVAATLALLWLVRRRRMLLFGLVWFCLAMGPVSQVMPHHIQRADRYFYLAFIGLAVAAAGALRIVATQLRTRQAAQGVVVASMLLLTVLGVKAAGQVWTWRDSLSAWENCLWVDPDNARAHDAFADNLVKTRRLDIAIPHYEKVLEILPNNVESMSSLSVQLACGDERLRDYDRAIKLGIRACDLTSWESVDVRDSLAQILSCRAYSLQERGDYGQAMDYYRQALKASPSHVDAIFNLALMLATCPDARLRRPAEAVRLAEGGVNQMPYPELNSYLILATAYAQAGQLQLAALTLDRTINFAKARGDLETAQALQAQSQFYRDAAAAGRVPQDIVIPPTAQSQLTPGPRITPVKPP